jgi:hypothetical protein
MAVATRHDRPAHRLRTRGYRPGLPYKTETTDEVVAAEARFTSADLETTGVDDTQCCYARRPRPGSPVPTTPARSGT